MFTLVAAARVGSSGMVAACEPIPATAAHLRENVAINRYQWVSVLEVALAEHRGVRQITAFGGNASGLSSFSPETVGGTVLQVKTVTLDSLASSTKPSLVKLDLEGAEVGALLGAPMILSSGCPFLVEVESHHLGRQGHTREDLFELFRSAGYQWRRVGYGPNYWFSYGNRWSGSSGC